MLKKIVIFALCFIFLLLTACKNEEENFTNNIQRNQEEKEEFYFEDVIKVSKEIHQKQEPVDVKREESKAKIIFAFGGDVMMDSFIGDYIQRQGVDYPWTDVQAIMQEADYSVVNLETSVSTGGTTKKKKGYGFRSHPDTVEGLANAGINVVSLANNHVMDFGKEALYETLEVLEQYTIHYVGAGKNGAEAEELKVIKKKGVTVGFLNFTSIIPWEKWTAAEHEPGAAGFRMNQYDHLLEHVELAKKKVDILVLLLHWGQEYAVNPSEKQIQLAHEAIDFGADIIVGHHPHVLQGVEFYHEKPIFYSIGNFVFLKNNEDCGKTGIFQVTWEGDSAAKVQFYPVHIQYCKANLLKDEDERKKEYIHLLNERSKQFGTKVDISGSISPAASKE